MTAVLLCATPLAGHVGPLTVIGADLVARGHEVHLLTGSRFGTRVRAAGITHHSVGGTADFDERDPDTFVPDAHQHRGLALSRYQVEHTFVRPITDQAAAVDRVIRQQRIDAVLTDSTFAGTLPLLSAPRTSRPAVIGVGVMPLAQMSVDVPPFNSGLRPMRGPVGRLRNRVANTAVRRVVFRSTQLLAEHLVADAGGELGTFVFDFSTLCDRFLQMGPAEFEYPRRDLAANTDFAGALPAPAGPAPDPPPWWEQVCADPRPIVHVTQGTLDNRDFTRLVDPTIAALVDTDVQVIVSAGGADTAAVARPLPPNTHLASYLDYEQLLPRTSVMVTNGGYGGVLTALRHAVPLVVAPAGEDKPEVAARVAHTGTGIDLRTATPTPDQIRTAVHTALTSPVIARRTAALAQAMTRYTPLETVHTALTAAVSPPPH